MIVNIVNVYVKSDFVEEFKSITKDNHMNSIHETGNFRFDVLQDEKDPTHFVLYEAFASQQAIEYHRESAHYFKWRDAVAPFMDKPRDAARYELLFPTEIKK